MSKEKISELLDAIRLLNAGELRELLEKLNSVFDLREPAAVSDSAELHIFSYVEQHIPSLYYDGDPGYTIWIDDYGRDFIAFFKLMRNESGLNLSLSISQMKRRFDFGKSLRFNLDREHAESLMEHLNSLGVSFEYAIDDVADYKVVKVCSLPEGFEEKLYQTIALTEDEPPSDATEYVVYTYREPVNDARQEPCMQDNAFVFLDTKTDKDGRMYRKWLTCLEGHEVRKLKKQGMISSEFEEAEPPYHVRIRPEARHEGGKA